jgi:L-lactate dehydrogenase
MENLREEQNMKIGIVGSGMVGATAAYALLMRGIGREIVLFDRNMARAQAEADDILHAAPFAHAMQVRAGDYADMAGSRVVIISAGVSQKPGETRLELLGRNATVFRSVIPSILEHAPDAILLVATNPVDIMTHLACHYASRMGVPPHRILGSGTTLDTARFRALVGRKLGVDPQHIHAYVIGEHGDSEVLTWSLVTVGGIPLEEFCRARRTSLCQEDYQEIEEQVRQAAYHIIAGKGATYYGVGSALARIVEVILHDQRSILTVCTRREEAAGVNDVTLSQPYLLSGNGILDIFPPPLDTAEAEALHASARVIRDAIDALEREGLE